MKAYAILFFVLFLSACALKVDQVESKLLAESLLNDLKNENYKDLDKYYAGLSNQSEPIEQKMERYRQLKETTGAIQSYEFMDAKEEYDSDSHLNQLQLMYKVVCENVTVKHTLLFINDEGSSRIMFHNIENLK